MAKYHTTPMESEDPVATGWTEAGAKSVMRRTLALAVAVLIAACTTAGDSPVSFSRFARSSTYDAGVFGAAAGRRDLRVVVVGNPFGGDRAAFEAAVTGAMQGSNRGQETNFTTTPGPDANENYRVVMVFSPPADVPGAQVCGSDPPVVSAAPYGGGRLDLFAVFCWSDAVMTQLAASVPGAEGAGDPLFTELVRQTTYHLFPQVNRLRHRSR